MSRSASCAATPAGPRSSMRSPDTSPRASTTFPCHRLTLPPASISRRMPSPGRRSSDRTRSRRGGSVHFRIAEQDRDDSFSILTDPHMSELLPPDSRTNAAEFTVSEISNALKRTVEDAFGNVRVRGEISGFRGPHSSGHAYFSLKDDRARIDAVIWRTTFQRLKFKPEEGMEVIVTGRLTTYPGKSTYQIVIDNLE